MLHFPSTLPKHAANGIPRRSDSLNLNATQQRSASHPIFLQVEEELHDARRVQADGQEDDLRSALSMVINRVSELSNLLSEAYKTQADLEVQLNVAKSNLKLVIANNEMLEDALKRDSGGQSKDIGWRRTSSKEEARNSRSSLDHSQAADYTPVSSDPSPPPSASTSQNQDNRFFKFRFSSNPTAARPASRPETPSGSSSQAASPHLPGVQAHHLTSPSMPSLSSVRSKELEDLTAELAKERAAKKAIAEQKAALEEELESLSQALFEEANKMVATERKMRAETEEELKELKLEKEALKSALRLIDGENSHLRESGLLSSPHSDRGTPSQGGSRTHSRSSSEVGIKSRPDSLVIAPYPPLPPSPAPSDDFKTPEEGSPQDELLTPGGTSPDAEESQPTPRYPQGNIPLPGTGTSSHSASSSISVPSDPLFNGSSPWADVPSSAGPTTTTTSTERRSTSSTPSIWSQVAYASIH
ncbi:hypothetical protein D9613_000047 [Agrocybe pediades]|uniref:GDP/GTP exchange factor Sec2 N-terminal domain-containing protein n=1 Tax=Agrocybe pediades TaxID=84607 RepID=A0A8H4R0B0_9AGAR|nr:hypothetical protein D9613_000047 [Agrocybe pediades]